MRFPISIPSRNRGSSLIETVIAVGVLAVALPLVFGALAESGKSTLSSEAETRSSWIVPTCMEEIQASRENRPQYFTATTVGDTFPSAGEVWALGFTAEGKPVGKISKDIYDKGAKEIDGSPIRYIVSLRATAQGTNNTAGVTPMLLARISLEYPSTSPAGKRQKLDFYTRIP